MRSRCLWFILLFLCWLTSNAQIINIEDRRGSLTDTSGIMGHIDLGLNLLKNTRTITTLTGNQRLEWLKEEKRVLLLSGFKLVNTGENRVVNEGFVHLRYNQAVRPKIVWEAFGQSQYNERLRIKVRALLGTGPRFQLLDKKKNKIYIGTLYMYEYNEIQDSSFLERDHRISSYVSLRYQVNPTFTIANTTYYQPLIISPGDFRLTTNTALQFTIFEHLSFRSSFSLAYDSRQASEVPGLPATTYNFNNGLRWFF